MADLISGPFFEGRGTAVDLRRIEAELTKLWGPAADQVSGPGAGASGERPHVTRVALANLVVASWDGEGASPRPVLETVTARFPCRAIVLRGSSDPERRIAAEISALCHLPAPGLPQVCSERIVLEAGPSALDLVPGAVRPLLEPDLPMVLWWVGDPRPHAALFRDLAAECSRLVLDLPERDTAFGALELGLDESICPFGRDAAWFGLARWRELIAQFFDPPGSIAALDRTISVWIEAVGAATGTGAVGAVPPEAPRVAVWLAAWLAGQLGWKPRGRPERVDAPGAAASELRAEVVGPRGPIALTIATTSAAPLGELENVSGDDLGPRVTGAIITVRRPDGSGSESDVDTFEVVRPSPGSTALRVQARASGFCGLPRLVEAPELDRARRIAAALESSRVDVPFRNALPIALWLLDDRADVRAASKGTSSL